MEGFVLGANNRMLDFVRKLGFRIEFDPDDPAVRGNRLALLAGVAATMNRVADISRLAR